MRILAAVLSAQLLFSPSVCMSALLVWEEGDARVECVDRFRALLPRHPNWLDRGSSASFLRCGMKGSLAGGCPQFCMLVHHTDAGREWAYDREAHIGRLDKALDEANARGWTVVDMKRDWTHVFRN